MSEEPSAERRRIEIVHESLLTKWPRLVRWQAQDEEGAVLRDQLRQAASVWDQHSRSEDFLWSGMAFREVPALARALPRRAHGPRRGLRRRNDRAGAAAEKATATRLRGRDRGTRGRARHVRGPAPAGGGPARARHLSHRRARLCHEEPRARRYRTGAAVRLACPPPGAAREAARRQDRSGDRDAHPRREPEWADSWCRSIENRCAHGLWRMGPPRTERS